MVDFWNLLKKEKEKTEQEREREEREKVIVSCVICSDFYSDPFLENKKIIHEKATGHNNWKKIDYSEYLIRLDREKDRRRIV